jgi:hypothetical protein
VVDISTIYKSNSDYLNAEEIGADMWTLTIFSADVKKWDNGDQKIVVAFNETDKVLPLNVTNARAIGDLYGGDTDAWVGKQIMLFTMPVDFQGKTVQAIRVRGPQRQITPQRRSAPVNDPARDTRYEGSRFDERNPPPRDEFPGDSPIMAG